ncbi:MAG: aspartate aminotransferase family protein [Chthoniobacterales bacterium]
MSHPTLQELRQKDRSYHIHPFTNHADMNREGTRWIKSGDGCWLVDGEGRRLLDGLAGLWCVNVGYNCGEIVEAVRRQMEELPYYPSFFNSTTEPPVMLAEWLAKRAPARLNKVVYSNSGSESNETALKIIRAYWKLRGKSQKRKVLSRNFAYHGVTLAATSLTGLPNCTDPFDLPLEDFVKIPAPYSWHDNAVPTEAYGAEVVAKTAEVIDREGADTIAAMFVEPIQGAGGVIVPPPGYLKALRELCREREILFVADEVITAFGRLGVWFASEREELDPDLLNIAKGLTSGYLPLGGTMVSDEIAEVILPAGYFAHGFTYTGHPVCTAAALANLHVIEERGLVERVRDDVGPYFQQKLLELAAHPAVGEVRGDNLIGAAELVPAGGRDALKPGMALGIKASDIIREEGSIVRGIRDLIALAPPLIITRAEIDELFYSVRRGLDRLWN